MQFVNAKYPPFLGGGEEGLSSRFSLVVNAAWQVYSERDSE